MKYSAILIVLLCVTGCTPVHANWTDIMDATCRVNRGSGIVFTEDEDYYWILSAGHCVVDDNGKKEKVEIQFFHTGHASRVMEAENYWHICKFDDDIISDLAVLKLKKSLLKDYDKPKIVPLASKKFRAKAGSVIHTCGRPGKNWPTIYRGHIKTSADDHIKIYPVPIRGRSGSGVYQNGFVIAITSVNAAKIHDLVKAKAR